MKVALFDKQLLKQFGSVVSGISIVLSLVVIFADIPDKIKTPLGRGFVVLLILGYIITWFRANRILCRTHSCNSFVWFRNNPVSWLRYD